MKPIFRNSMFGFHKEDVYNFITKQSRQYESKINELTEEKTKIENELSKEQERSLLLSDEVESLRDGSDKSLEILNQIRALSLSVSEAMNEVLVCADLCDTQNNKIKETFTTMEGRLEKAELFREKAEKFDQLSNVLSSIIVGNKNGEDTLAQMGSQVTANPIAFPENDGLVHLREALSTLSNHCDALNKIISESNDDE